MTRTITAPRQAQGAIERAPVEEVRTPFDLMRTFKDVDLENMANALFKSPPQGGVPPDDLRLFLWRCHVTRLDPWLGHIVPIYRGGKLTIQTSVDGYLAAAMRTGELVEVSEPQYGEDDSQGRPVSARVTVTRAFENGREMKVGFTAYLKEFHVETNSNWKDRPRHMLGLRALGHALRRGFPDALSGIDIGGADDDGDRPVNSQASTVSVQKPDPRDEEKPAPQKPARTLPPPVKVGAPAGEA